MERSPRSSPPRRAPHLENLAIAIAQASARAPTGSYAHILKTKSRFCVDTFSFMCIRTRIFACVYIHIVSRSSTCALNIYICIFFFLMCMIMIMTTFNNAGRRHFMVQTLTAHRRAMHMLKSLLRISPWQIQYIHNVTCVAEFC